MEEARPITSIPIRVLRIIALGIGDETIYPRSKALPWHSKALKG
jgi:hypothetical protein